MAITFNTNLAALGAQRNIGIASNSASSSLSKLSSGSRVPQAKDDAAGLAIGSKLKSEVAGLTQASNNAAQAISLLQIADGALSTLGDVLQRMKALAVQSSSGQLADADRSLLNQEFSGLRSEVDRVAALTNFNGTTLLNGGQTVMTSTQTQSGFFEGKGIKMSFDTSVTAADATYKVDYDFNNTNIGSLTVTNLTDGSKQTIDVGAAIRAVTGEASTALSTNLTAGRTIDVNFTALGVTLTLDSTFDVDTDINQAPTTAFVSQTVAAGFTNTTTSAVYNGAARLTGAQLNAITTLGAFDATTGKLNFTMTNTGVNTVTVNAITGLDYSKDGSTWVSGANLTTVATNAANAGFYVRATGSTGTLAFVNLASTVTSATASTATFTIDLSGMARGVESTSATKQFSFKVGTGTASDDSITFTLNAATGTALGVVSSAIDTAANANLAITAVNAAINSVSSRRADIGAAQSRLDFASKNISVAIENTTAAQSALLDVDVSAEITKFTNQNVLMQAGISLLGQANQQPALLLRLLQ